MVFRPLLVKMHCCIVLSSATITVLLLLYGSNFVNAGISGTVALVYGIGLGMLTCILVHDKVVNRGYVEAAAEESAG